MFYKLYLLLCLPFLAYAVAHTEDGELRELQNSLIDRAGINASSLPTIEDAQNIFKKKCLKEADEAAFEKADKGKDELKDCIMGLVDFETIKKEIEEAKPTGDMDLVFKKYCLKSPDLRKCVSNFVDTIQPCLAKKEKENMKIVLNITESLTNFICYKEGDRIALFIAEGGPECLQEKQEGIQNCVNSTVSKYTPEGTPSVDNIPELLFQTEECDDLTKLQDCIVAELSTCKEPTPGNIAESLFKFIRQVTPCGNTKPKAVARNEPIASSASITVINTIVLFASVLYIIH